MKNSLKYYSNKLLHIAVACLFVLTANAQAIDKADSLELWFGKRRLKTLDSLAICGLKAIRYDERVTWHFRRARYISHQIKHWDYAK